MNLTCDILSIGWERPSQACLQQHWHITSIGLNTRLSAPSLLGVQCRSLAAFGYRYHRHQCFPSKQKAEARETVKVDAELAKRLWVQGCVDTTTVVKVSVTLSNVYDAVTSRTTQCPLRIPYMLMLWAGNWSLYLCTISADHTQSYINVIVYDACMWCHVASPDISAIQSDHAQKLPMFIMCEYLEW